MSVARYGSQVSLTCCRCVASVSTAVGGAVGASTASQIVYQRRKPKNSPNTFGQLGSFGRSVPLFRSREAVRPKDRDAEWDTSSREEYEAPTRRHWESKVKEHKRTLTVISEPLTWTKAQRRKAEREHQALEEYTKLYGVDCTQAKMVIRCARKEFNHYEGMRYPMREIPLASQHWAKNKYKDDWFVIEPTTKNPSFGLRDACCWEQFMDTVDYDIAQNAIKAGFARPTDVQARTLAALSSSKHLFIAAETGSGKTAAFAIPLLSQILKHRLEGKKTKALILIPTKELEIQTKRMISVLSAGTSIKICRERNEDNQPTDSSQDCEWDILVSTPGMASKTLAKMDTQSIETVIIDEADMLLDDSFVNPLSDIFDLVKLRNSETNRVSNGGARVVFSSASCPDELQGLVESIADAEELQYVKTQHLHGLLPHVQQKFVRVREMDKVDLLMELLQKPNAKGQKFVFCKDRSTVDFLSSTLTVREIPHIVLGCGGKREETFSGLPEGKSDIILGTDAASRGLDFPNLAHVVNYDFPRHMVDYIHRVGRVGRVASKFNSRVTSFVRCPWEVTLVNAIELAARFNEPIEGVEANVSGMLREREQEKVEAADVL